MARFNDSVKVTPGALRHVSGALRKLADIQDQQATAMEAAGIHEIEAKNLKSALMALVSLGKFTGSATTNFCDAISEDGVSELEGAVLQFRRYLKRGSGQIKEPATNRSSKDAPGFTAAEAYDKHAGDAGKRVKGEGRAKR